VGVARTVISRLEAWPKGHVTALDQSQRPVRM